ncbi:MAG: metal-dependent hydrolase [Anaerolineae bacterium]
MKGIAHFLTGVAVATCFPEVVALARQGSLLPMLGGVFGLLPDTLDFKFARYWETYDIAVDPGIQLGTQAQLDGDSEVQTGEPTAAEAAGRIAEAFVAATRRAYRTDRPVSLIAHTVRMGADLWRRYTIRLDPGEGTVAARIGPLVSTSQLIYPGTEPPGAVWSVRHLGIPLEHTYRREYHVDAFTGPSFRFVREGDRVVVHFLDWHHRWTHSLPLAVGIGILTGLTVALVWNWEQARYAGALAALAYGAHVLEDQLGHMGCNLFWPLTRRRMPGLGLLHAGDGLPNFLVVWSALALIFLNLDRWGGPGLLRPGPYVLGVVGLPWLILTLNYLYHRARTGTISSDAGEDAERAAEAEDVVFG